MNENTFQRDLKKGMSAQGIFAYKIPDSAMGMTKPCDIIGCWRGVHMSVECKIEKSNDISPSRIWLGPSDFKNREHQLVHTRMICKSGGLGLIAIGCYQTRHPWTKKAFLIRADKLPDPMRPMIGHIIEAIGAPMTWVPEIGWGIDERDPQVRKALFLSD